MSQTPEDDLAEQIATLLRDTFAGRVQDEPRVEARAVPAVTLAEVTARLQLDTAREGGLEAGDARALQALIALRERPLPPRLTPRAVGDYLAQIGVSASPRFCQSFAEAAIFLRMGRKQTAHLAAQNQKSP